MLKNSLFSLLCSTPFFCFSLFLSFFQRRTSLSFLFVFQPLTFASALLFFSFGSRVPFFSAQKHSFQPKTILSSAQKHFFQTKRFSIFQPKRFSVFLQPLFSSSFFLLYSFLPLATTYCPFSAQVFSSKPFSAVSCLFIWVNLHFLQIWNKI